MLKTILYTLFALSLGFSPLSATEQTNTQPITLKKSAHALNIIYFLGNDTKPVEDYERRLSELMIHLQQFYGKEMARNGFGARSFGMDMKSPDKIDILVYKAKNPASFYPYENGGGGKAIAELEEYFKTTGKKKSQHMLIIMPTWNDEKNNALNPGGVPFYGMGKNCFALDYPAFDIKHMGQDTHEGRLLTKWYGGLAHELGHGLNLHHNHATKSDTEKLGTALMGAGNYTFGSKPTFLTPASCAILDTCEVFSVDPKQVYYNGEKDLSFPKITINFENNNIIVSGEYKSNHMVKSLNVYVQDPPYVVNKDYDAVPFREKLGKKQGKFKVKINRDELSELKDNTFQISLLFILDNGEQVRHNVEFKRDALNNYSFTNKSK